MHELLQGTKDAASQEVKKDVSSLRYIALPNWAHDALLEFSSSKPQDHCSTEVPKGSGNPNPTTSTSNPPADQMETLTVETPIPTVSSPVLTAYSSDSQEPSSDARLISKRVANQEETPSLDNIISLTNRFEDILGGTTNSDEPNEEEADISNMETAITTSPTPTLKIHKDHPKSQIIGPMDTLIQTKNKSKEKISDALQDPSWVEAMQEELLQFKIQNVWTLVDCPKGEQAFWSVWEQQATSALFSTSTTDSQMHYNIMAAGLRDHPPMLPTGIYAQWRSRFLRYIDTRPNGDALRKCILEGPYTPTTVVVPAELATNDSPAVPEHTIVETPMNMSPKNKAHYE
nr:ribonuclease H-like domain-containing protein [Tanacetum cinerariifolium]